MSHCFNVNNGKSPDVIGISGLLEAYKNSLMKIKLLGPTLLFNLIKNKIETLKKITKQHKEYHIFIIILDGQINDLIETQELLFETSKHPISFILIGVGTANFENMYKLCKLFLNLGNNSNSNGKKTLRKNIQFVLLKDFNFTTEELLESVLQFIPGQIIEYFN